MRKFNQEQQVGGKTECKQVKEAGRSLARPWSYSMQGILAVKKECVTCLAPWGEQSEPCFSALTKHKTSIS